MMKQPNPQGKGLVPVLDSLRESRTLISVAPKHINQISTELFTSLFVLHSHFQFKPVVGKSYWLYLREHHNGDQNQHPFQLSLISPQEWGGDGFGLFVGECVLQQDITWSLILDPVAEQDVMLMALIEKKRDEFETALNSAVTIDDALPFYLDGLPFYQRVFASALANSLKTSMLKSGIQGLSYAQAQKRLPGQ